jgi:hypothetical protein
MLGVRIPQDISLVTPTIVSSHSLSGDITGIRFDMDAYADMVLDEILMNLRNAAYRPGKHVMPGEFHLGTTSGPVGC